MTQPPVPPSSRVQHPVSPALERLTLQCLAKQPDERPRSAGELRERLAQIAFAEPWSRERAATW